MSELEEIESPSFGSWNFMVPPPDDYMPLEYLYVDDEGRFRISNSHYLCRSFSNRGVDLYLIGWRVKN